MRKYHEIYIFRVTDSLFITYQILVTLYGAVSYAERVEYVYETARKRACQNFVTLRLTALPWGKKERSLHMPTS